MPFPRAQYCVILRSEMCVLITISNVWNFEEDKKCLVRLCITALVYVQTCVTLIYILGICDARDSEFFTLRGGNNS